LDALAPPFLMVPLPLAFPFAKLMFKIVVAPLEATVPLMIKT